MDLRDMLAGVHDYHYDHRAGRDQPAQRHLRDVRDELAEIVPPGMRVRVSGSGQSLPLIPWIAVLDPDVTMTAKKGLYVVYLYRRDLSAVYLSMNQGATDHRTKALDSGLKERSAAEVALEQLLQESIMIRGRLSADALAHLSTTINLDASGYFLPEGYECGNVAAIDYNLPGLPDAENLRQDLTRMLALYSSCVEIEKDIVTSDPLALTTAVLGGRSKATLQPKPPLFRPKSSAAYVVEVPAQSQKRQRRHEELVRRFGKFASQAGMVSATNVHPRDLTVTHGMSHWLIEAKTVGSNAEFAVREAIGQLFAYRHFYYRERHDPDPNLVALFSESIGQAFVDLLVSVGIESIWPNGKRWEGCAVPTNVGLLETIKAMMRKHQ